VARIEKEVRHLEVIVGDFLAHARRPALVPRALAVRPLLEEVAAHVAAEGVHVDVEAAPALSLVADEHQLRRSLLNLGKNAAAAARKQHPEGGGRVGFFAEERDDEVVLRVSDNGAGVPASLRDQIFVPFFTTKEQGTGLGLAFVKDTAEAHGGCVSLLPATAPSEARDGGATFEIRLPKRAPASQDRSA